VKKVRGDTLHGLQGVTPASEINKSDSDEQNKVAGLSGKK